jgi:hypothetical protein
MGLLNFQVVGRWDSGVLGTMTSFYTTKKNGQGMDPKDLKIAIDKKLH